MLCAPLDWQYAELPSSASDAVLCSVFVRKDVGHLKTNRKKKKQKKKNVLHPFPDLCVLLLMTYKGSSN